MEAVNHKGMGIRILLWIQSISLHPPSLPPSHNTLPSPLCTLCTHAAPSLTSYPLPTPCAVTPTPGTYQHTYLSHCLTQCAMSTRLKIGSHPLSTHTHPANPPLTLTHVTDSPHSHLQTPSPTGTCTNLPSLAHTHIPSLFPHSPPLPHAGPQGTWR